MTDVKILPCLGVWARAYDTITVHTYASFSRVYMHGKKQLSQCGLVEAVHVTDSRAPRFQYAFALNAPTGYGVCAYMRTHKGRVQSAGAPDGRELLRIPQG